MVKFATLLIIPALLAKVSQDRDNAYMQQRNKKELLFYIPLVLFLSVFAGIRTEYNDTIVYIDTYNLTTSGLADLFQNISIGSDYFGYLVFKSFVKTLGFDSQIYIFFCALVPCIVYLWFIRKHARKSFFLAAYLFVVCGYTFIWAAIKQCFAISLLLVAVDALIEKKYIKVAIAFFAAYLFHPSVLVAGVLLLFYKAKPWSRRTFLMMGILMALGAGMRFTSSFFEGFLGYGSNVMLSHTMNPIRFLVTAAPLIVSFIYRDYLYENVTDEIALIFHMSLCEVVFMFWALFGNPIVFARLAYFFSAGSWVSLSWIALKLRQERRFRDAGRIILVAAMVLYGVFFYMEFQNFGGINNVLKQCSVFDLMKSFRNWFGLLYR